MLNRSLHAAACSLLDQARTLLEMSNVCEEQPQSIQSRRVASHFCSAALGFVQAAEFDPQMRSQVARSALELAIAIEAAG
jgi:hypothetical protein